MSFRTTKALALLATLAFAAPALAQIPFTENFDAENGGTGQLNYTAFANWTVSAGSVDIIGNGFFDFYSGNGLYVDLAGSTGQAGTITSAPFAFVPGQIYTLGFTLGGNTGGPTNTVAVLLGSLVSDSLTLPPSQGLTNYSYNFSVLAPTNAALSFRNVEDGDRGAILTNVSIIPAPAAAAMLALAGIAATRRRR